MNENIWRNAFKMITCSYNRDTNEEIFFSYFSKSLFTCFSSSPPLMSILHFRILLAFIHIPVIFKIF